MKLKEHYHGKIVVLDVHGNLMGGEETASIHDKIKELIGEGFKYFVMNLGSVKWMNSSGLGTLMSCLTTTTAADGEMKIANVTDKVESLLMITQLTKVFHNYDSVDKAVASFEV